MPRELDEPGGCYRRDRASYFDTLPVSLQAKFWPFDLGVVGGGVPFRDTTLFATRRANGLPKRAYQGLDRDEGGYGKLSQRWRSLSPGVVGQREE